jgi:hypothetical protein
MMIPVIPIIPIIPTIIHAIVLIMNVHIQIVALSVMTVKIAAVLHVPGAVTQTAGVVHAVVNIAAAFAIPAAGAWSVVLLVLTVVMTGGYVMIVCLALLISE